jgi:hypothetical protein
MDERDGVWIPKARIRRLVRIAEQGQRVDVEDDSVSWMALDQVRAELRALLLHIGPWTPPASNSPHTPAGGA